MILCCGEALIDMIPATSLDGAEAFVPHCGGAAYNSAIALGRLGLRTGLLSGLSRDMFGRQLAAGLQASHVDLSLAVFSDRPTTLAFVRLVDGDATYAFHDENSAGRMLTACDMPTLPPDVTALLVGGISLVSEPCADAYAALVQGGADGRAIMLDPNVRPGFIRDSARYRRRLDRMLARADIVKVSQEDLDWIAPGPVPVPEKIGGILARGPALVILTRGAAGATGYLANGRIVEVPALPARVCDTVGAGDTFNAGVLAKLSELGQLNKPGLADLSPETLREALAHGARAAAISVSRAGANPPWADELQAATVRR